MQGLFRGMLGVETIAHPNSSSLNSTVNSQKFYSAGLGSGFIECRVPDQETHQLPRY